MEYTFIVNVENTYVRIKFGSDEQNLPISAPVEQILQKIAEMSKKYYHDFERLKNAENQKKIAMKKYYQTHNEKLKLASKERYKKKMGKI